MGKELAPNWVPVLFFELDLSLFHNLGFAEETFVHRRNTVSTRCSKIQNGRTLAGLLRTHI